MSDLNCRIVIKNDKGGYDSLPQQAVIDILADKGEITPNNILLYDLGKATGLEKQRLVVELLKKHKLTESYADEDEDMDIPKTELEDWRVSGRSQIVVKGNRRAFDRAEWEESIRRDYRNRIGASNENLSHDEIEVRVENSLGNVKKFNDERAKLGTDAHKIAEIVFQNEDVLDSNDSILAKITELLDSGEIKFKSDFYQKNTKDIRKETVEFFRTLKQRLYALHGTKCQFLTESSFRVDNLNTRGSFTNFSDYLCGTIDLTVVDEEGVIHLYDFKTSTHGYEEWPEFKKHTTAVQLYSYKRMLSTLSDDLRFGELNTIPFVFKVDTDSYDEKTKSYTYTYTGVKPYDSNRHPINKLNGVLKSSHKRTVDNWFPNAFRRPLPSEYMETERLMNEAFIVSETESGEEDITAPYFTKDRKGNVVPNKETLREFNFYEYSKTHPMRVKYGYLYSYKMYGENTTLCKSVDDLRTHLKESMQQVVSTGLNEAVDLAKAFAEEYERANGEPEKINYDNILGAGKERRIWLEREVSHYLENGNYELNTDPVYLEQGYLLWKHKTLGFVECVVLSGNPLMKIKRLAKGTTLLGKIYDDGHVDKKEIMTASNGNLALMQFMAFIANSPGAKDWCSKMIDANGDEQKCKIASVRVINPSGFGAKEIRPNLGFIISNYETLCNNSGNLLKGDKSFKKIDNSLFFNDPQSLALQAVSQCEDLVPIYEGFDTTNFSFDYKKVDDVLEFVDKCLNTLLKGKNKEHYQILENFDPSDPNWRAIFYLINIQNALHGHTYIAELGNGKWFNDGLSPTGLMISAPGMSTSTTLRTFDEINKAYVDSVIQAVTKYGKPSKDACIEAYQLNGMDKLLGGPSNGSFYLDMFETQGGALDEDFKLKSPFDPEMRPGQKKIIQEFMLLNYRLTTLSQGSKKALDELTDQQKDAIYKDPQWLRVPLMDAAFSRQLHNHHSRTNNWFETVKYAVTNKWRELGNLYDDVMVDQLDDFQDRIDTYLKNSYVIDKRCTWNRFSYSMDATKRYELLTKFGPDRFETNLEIVMDNMLVAFFKEHFSKQFASQLSALRLELTYAKRAGQDVGDVIDVFDLAVRTKFYGESPIPKDLHKIFRPLARLKSVFSMLQIGGKAVSMLKELVYGTFIGFSNVVGQSLPGVDAETYWKAYKYVVTEAWKSSKGVSKLNHLQMQYHIANYGLSQVANQRRYNSLGWRNWGTDTLFLTATSPDFFHRMIILVSKMMADGIFDTAYEFDEDALGGYGELKYDVMKDPRFAKFTAENPDYDDPEYWQQKAMFEQYVQEFNKTGVTGPNGEKLTMERDRVTGKFYLPRPYLQREVDTFKNYADMLYGHYDDESKALVNDTFLGAFWLQYKTFVTAKIERYGMRPGVYNTHLLQQQYVTDEKGNKEALYLKTIWETGADGKRELHRTVIKESELSDRDRELRKLGTAGDPETGESVTAFIKWEGIPMEGIMHSIGSFSNTIKRIIMGDKNALAEFKLMWEDPTKRGNLIVALNDLILMGLLGMTASALFGMHNDLDFTEAWGNEAAVRQLVRSGNWAENGLYDIFVGAMQDGPITNTVSSMFQAPPIMTSIERAWSDSIKLLKGDSSAFEFLTNEVGALRIFDGMAQAAAAN